ncbi:hypothetical protein AOLI_G00027210 [Acnodon oligacanthus]
MSRVKAGVEERPEGGGASLCEESDARPWKAPDTQPGRAGVCGAEERRGELRAGMPYLFEVCPLVQRLVQCVASEGLKGVFVYISANKSGAGHRGQLQVLLQAEVSTLFVLVFQKPPQLGLDHVPSLLWTTLSFNLEIQSEAEMENQIVKTENSGSRVR